MNELSNILMNIIGTEDKKSTNYIIASYVMINLSHLQKNDNLTTGYLAKECNVSKASISRFCREIGLDDFYSFKDKIKKFDARAVMSSKYIYGDTNLNIIDNFRYELDKTINTFFNNLDIQLLKQLVKDIYHHKHVIIMGHQQSFATGLILQNDLAVSCNKYIDVCGEPNKQIEYLMNATEDDLFIIISARGHFFENIHFRNKKFKYKNKSKIYMISSSLAYEHPYIDYFISLVPEYNYPATILLNIYIGLIANYYYSFIHET